MITITEQIKADPNVNKGFKDGLDKKPKKLDIKDLVKRRYDELPYGFFNVQRDITPLVREKKWCLEDSVRRKLELLNDEGKINCRKLYKADLIEKFGKDTKSVFCWYEKI